MYDVACMIRVCMCSCSFFWSLDREENGARKRTRAYKRTGGEATAEAAGGEGDSERRQRLGGGSWRVRHAEASGCSCMSCMSCMSCVCGVCDQ